MFGNMRLKCCLLTIVLLCAGCGASLNVENGIDPNIVLKFDNEFELMETVEKGWLIGLTMRSPKKSGYSIIGASFDPDILKLVRFYDYEEDGERRKAYVLEGVRDGLSDVLVKMKSETTGTVEIYKRAQIKVGERDGFF